MSNAELKITPPKASITRSRAGHYTVSVRENGVRVFHATLLSSLKVAQQKLEDFYKNRAA